MTEETTAVEEVVTTIENTEATEATQEEVPAQEEAAE